MAETRMLFSPRVYRLNTLLKPMGYRITNFWAVNSERKYGIEIKDIPLQKVTTIYIPREEIDGYTINHVFRVIRRYYYTGPFKDEKRATKIKLRRKIRV